MNITYDNQVEQKQEETPYKGKVDTVLGKRSMEWGESPDVEHLSEHTPPRKKKLTLRHFMMKACADIKHDIDQWHTDNVQLLDGHLSKGEAIRPYFYKLYGELLSAVSFVENELESESSDSEASDGWSNFQ